MKHFAQKLILLFVAMPVECNTYTSLSKDGQPFDRCRFVGLLVEVLFYHAFGALRRGLYALANATLGNIELWNVICVFFTGEPSRVGRLGVAYCREGTPRGPPLPVGCHPCARGLPGKVLAFAHPCDSFRNWGRAQEGHCENCFV